jgi:hypothetical protein
MKRLFPIILLMLCAALNSVAQCLTDAKVESRVRAVVPVKKSAPLRKVYGPQNSKCAVYDVDGGGFIIASTDERMPDVLSGAMGNQMYMALLETEDDVREFADYTLDEQARIVLPSLFA